MDKELLEEIIEEVRARVKEYIKIHQSDDDEIHGLIKTLVTKQGAERGVRFGILDTVEIENKVYSLTKGFGFLDDILRNDDVTEIMINGSQNIFVEQGGKIIRLEQKFESEERLKSIIDNIVERVSHREVNQSNPVVDARLEDGSRVNVVVSPIAIDGHAVTIRKFSKEPMTFERLIKYGSITPQIAKLLQELVEARYNIFISGGTGSGKTTFLNAMSNYIPGDERVITIEDSAELQITKVDNIVRMETRNANTEGKGSVSIKDLIKSSLRMRPDRIVVGEVRGAEALDMLQAMNTGHDGSLSTGHANSAKDMLSRLETMVLQGAELPLPAIRSQIASAVDIIIHLSRLRDRSRKTMSISEVTGIDDKGNVEMNYLFEFREDKEKTSLKKVAGNLVRTKNPLFNTEKLLSAGKDLSIFDEKNFN